MNNKITISVLTFVAGAIIGAIIVWMLNKNTSRQIDTPPGPITADTAGMHLIPKTVANTYFKAYLTSFLSIDTLKAFTINAQQFNAMNRIARNDSTVLGFRIYFGKNGQTPIKMVVGFGSPDHYQNIYVTRDEGSGPCPIACDYESTIMEK
jgi:hypothetical protein